MAEVFLGDRPTRQDADVVKAYAEKHGLKSLLLPDVKQVSRSPRYNWTVPEMPHHVLVGKDGVVVSSGRAVPSSSDIEKALK